MKPLLTDFSRWLTIAYQLCDTRQESVSIAGAWGKFPRNPSRSSSESGVPVATGFQWELQWTLAVFSGVKHSIRDQCRLPPHVRFDCFIGKQKNPRPDILFGRSSLMGRVAWIIFKSFRRIRSSRGRQRTYTRYPYCRNVHLDLGGV